MISLPSLRRGGEGRGERGVRSDEWGVKKGARGGRREGISERKEVRGEWRDK